MNVLSHNIRVIPIAANFRSLGGNFGDSGMTKLLRIFVQSLEKNKLVLMITNASYDELGLNFFHCPNDVIRCEVLFVDRHRI